MQNREKLLIFGGTAFIGLTLLNQIKKTGQQYEIYCLNRKNVYWDNEVQKRHPQVKQVYCDRENVQGSLKVINQLNQQLNISESNRWKGVLDCSAYYEHYLKGSIPALKGKIDRYIIISTDSLYNNSLDRVKQPITEDSFDLKQEWALLPPEEQIKDSYGYHKFKNELYLNSQEDFPFVCLRFPDVLGPYDQFVKSQRVWCTINWLKQSSMFPVLIHKRAREWKLSFIDSVDAVKMMIELIDKKEVPSRAYNLALDDNPTLFEFEQQLASALGIEVKFEMSEKEVVHPFPSVDSGVIDTTRAKKQLNWKPTTLKQSLGRIVQFYKMAEDRFPQQLKMMKEEFRKTIVETYFKQ